MPYGCSVTSGQIRMPREGRFHVPSTAVCYRAKSQTFVRNTFSSWVTRYRGRKLCDSGASIDGAMHRGARSSSHLVAQGWTRRVRHAEGELARKVASMTRNSRPRSGGYAANRPTRTHAFALAFGVGVALAAGHGVASADTRGADSAGGSANHSGSATTGSASGSASPGPGSLSAKDTASALIRSGAASTHAGPWWPTSNSGGAGADIAPGRVANTDIVRRAAASSAGTAPLIPSDVAHADVREVAKRGSPQTAVTASSALVSQAPVLSNSGPVQPNGSVSTAPPRLASTPAPRIGATVGTLTVGKAMVSAAASTPAVVSPNATIPLPARIVFALLGLVGITTASGTTPTPISPAPVVQLLFAAFRLFENIAGLDSTPPTQPVLISETFTGSLTTVTPTVAEFLDAATAEYVLGGAPAGLRPFTVNGRPVTYTNDFTGTAAQVWVTPQNQIIIAYQGTTGGTNLLFNPLIAVSQVLADTQGTLTNTTPAAFTDALQFAKRVQAEAAEQGYAPNSVFLTGHSLGAWEAEYVAENTGLGGIGFEGLGLSTTVPGNGADSMFVNVATYGDPAAFSASDLPGLQPIEAPYVPGGGSNPHYGPIVLLGDPSSQMPLTNATAMWGTGIVGDFIAGVTAVGQFFEYHLPGVQAYSLDVNPEPDLLPGIGVDSGPVYAGFENLTIPEFLEAASVAGILIEP